MMRATSAVLACALPVVDAPVCGSWNLLLWSAALRAVYDLSPVRAYRHGCVRRIASRCKADDAAQAFQSVTLPVTQVVTAPPIQISGPSCVTCTRPLRPNAVP